MDNQRVPLSTVCGTDWHRGYFGSRNPDSHAYAHSDGYAYPNSHAHHHGYADEGTYTDARPNCHAHRVCARHTCHRPRFNRDAQRASLEPLRDGYPRECASGHGHFN